MQLESLASRIKPAGTVAPAMTLWTVQVMRGIAALMIVVGHSQSAVLAMMTAAGHPFARLTVVPWGASVDLFFVISGFIIVHASKQLFGQPGARGEFLLRRIGRIVPLYWVVTLTFLTLLAAASLKGGDRFPGAPAIIAAFAFVPVDTYGDGRLFPVLDLGWTLNYEMFFYAVLALLIPLPRRRALAGVAVAITALVAVGTRLPAGSSLWFWTRPIIVDFGLGVAVGALLSDGAVLARPLRLALALGGLVLLLADPGHVFNGPLGTTVANEWPRVLLAGVPVATILAAAVLGPELRLPRLVLPFTRIGDASYSLYLLHPFALIVTEKLVQKSVIVRALPAWLLVAATVALALVLALAGYRWLERPMTDAIGRRLRARRGRRPPGPAAE